MKFTASLIIFLVGFCVFAQETPSNVRTKKVVVRDSIRIDSVSINPSKFILKMKNDVVIDSSFYNIDFATALLTFRKPIETDSVTIEYLRYPDFITRKYFQLDDAIIVENTDNMQRLYKLEQSTLTKNFTPLTEGVLSLSGKTNTLNSLCPGK